MGVAIGAGLSRNPDARAAAVAAGGLAREGLGGAHADLAIVFTAGVHLRAPEEVLDGVREALDPGGLIGCGAGGVLAGRQEVEGGTATAVWAAALGDGGRAETFHAELVEGPDGLLLAGLPDEGGSSAFVVLPDPTSFPVDLALAELAASAPTAPILGGLASAGTGAGDVVLFCDDAVVDGGAVGVRLIGTEVLACVSQGATPVGPELTVTAADEHVILELAGRPALETLQSTVARLDRAERALVSDGVLLGLVVGPDRADLEPGDYLVRGLLDADPSSGAVTVGHPVRAGQVVRLHARDAGSAGRDLREILGMSRTALGQATPAGALLFTCNGRGEAMFGVPGHDADAVADLLGDPPTAGFFAAGELGPVGGVPALHGFTATMAIFPR